MTEPATERIKRSLVRLDGPGSFSFYHYELAQGLTIKVDGVGDLDLPLTPSDAERLIAAATASPFGYRDQTVQDDSVRDSWEIPGDAVHLDPRSWSRRFDRALTEVTEALGFPTGAVVQTKLEKLLIYGPGQFFAPHRDTEKSAAMVATMVVSLPCAHTGGELVVSHAGTREVYDTAKDAARERVGFVGFYADCVHETKPVREGHRVALVHSIALDAPEDALPGDRRRDLHHGVAAHFEEDDGEWLIVLLEHEYSHRGLHWSRVKNTDRVRVEALRRVAAELECDCFLAIADVREAFEIDEEDTSGFEGYGPPPGGYGPSLEMELSLDGWIDERGRSCAGSDEPADHECVVMTVDGHARDVEEATYTPWTGNEGGHAEVWYHQAAVVLVPRGTDLHAEIGEPLTDAPTEEVAEPSPTPRSRAVVRRRKKA